MNRLHDIGIREVRTAMEDGGNAAAILAEVETLLTALIERDEGGSIDLRSLPLSDADLVALGEKLGLGEVYAEVDALGLSRVQETGIPGVWWIMHQNEEEEIIGEFIEVTYCPEILMTPVEDVKEGLSSLRARLLEASYGKTAGGEHGE